MTEEADKAVWAKCKSCEHVWIAAYYPMVLHNFAKIMEQHSQCPKCNGEAVLAKQENGVLMEDRATKDDSEIVLYSADPDAELITATTVAEAVEMQVDQWTDPPGPDDEIEVTSYRRMALPSRDQIARVALDTVIEWLDEEYGDPDGDTGEHAAGVLHDHSLAFAEAVRANYVPWACEPVETFKVLVRDHVPDDWIKGGDEE